MSQIHQQGHWIYYDVAGDPEDSNEKDGGTENGL